MLIPQDDLIGHQMPTSFAFNASSDPAWMERYWFTAHPVPGGDMILNLGLGLHPNKNVMDAHAGFTIGNEQHNLRLSRHLGRDPMTPQLGPLKFEVLEGMRRTRITLEPNDFGLSFDIEFVTDIHPHEEETRLVRRNNRVIEHLMRYQQVGRYRGWIELKGQRFDLDTTQWWGQRDHSWGIRSDMRTDPDFPPVSKYPPHLFTWCVAQFDRRAIQMFMMDRGPGDYIYLSGEEVLPQSMKPDRTRHIRLAEHDFTWRQDDYQGQTADAMRWKLTFADGSQKTIEARPLPARYFLKGGLYGGYKGWYQGNDKGRFYSEHDVWDLADPATRADMRTLCDNVMEYRDGDEIGYGICEYWVVPGYPRYPEIQHKIAP